MSAQCRQSSKQCEGVATRTLDVLARGAEALDNVANEARALVLREHRAVEGAGLLEVVVGVRRRVLADPVLHT